MSWETFEHDADIGLVIRGSGGAELFSEAGRALFSLVCDLEAVEERERYSVAGEADSVEPLLVDWLNDLVFLFQARNIVCRRFSFLGWSETAYSAEALGEPVDPSRHSPRDLVKAATYHGLSVELREDGLEARVILDV